jgi:hypothetical protein
MIALCLCVAVLSSAQAPVRPPHPDFSGEWVLVAPASLTPDAATALTVRQPITDRNVRGEPMPPSSLELLVERHVGDTVQTERHAIGIVGGTVSGAPGLMHETTESATWRDDSLVISTTRSSGPRGNMRVEQERSETWRLDAAGQLVIEISERAGRSESTMVLTYRRR